MTDKIPVIKTTDLSVDFANVRALDDVSMQINAGTIFGFLGPNGAGKTTTIRILLGILKATHGRAFVMGLDTLTDADKIRQNSGVLLEHNGLYEILSAEDNLEFYARIWQMPDLKRKERIKELLTHIGLWERRKEKVGSWSKGMKQKLAVARCFLHRPSLIFLDEPTSGLDPAASASLRNDLRSIVEKEGASIFLTTHNLEEAEKVCNNVGIISKGKLLAIGTPDELKTMIDKRCLFEIKGKGISGNIVEKLKLKNDINVISYKNDMLSIELLKSENISSVIAEIISAGTEIQEAKRVQPSLEKVYLTLMEENK